MAVIELLRRLVLSAFVLVIPSSRSLLRLTLALLTVFLYLVLLVLVQPFKRSDDQFVAAASNVMLVFVFLTAILVKIFDDVASDQAGSKTLAQRVLGFDSSLNLSLTIVAIGFMQVLLVIVVVAHKAHEALKAAQLEQQRRNQARVTRAIQACRRLSHPAIFITFEKLRELGCFTSHETVRTGGGLHILDTYNQFAEFTSQQATLFVSHRMRPIVLLHEPGCADTTHLL